MVRVEMIPDVKEDIVASVRGLSERVGPDGFVFTSGGIGVRCVLSSLPYASIPIDDAGVCRAAR